MENLHDATMAATLRNFAHLDANASPGFPRFHWNPLGFYGHGHSLQLEGGLLRCNSLHHPDPHRFRRRGLQIAETARGLSRGFRKPDFPGTTITKPHDTPIPVSL
jgi:hypothetical protein